VKNTFKFLMATIALALTTFVVIKNIALGKPATITDRNIFLGGIICGFVHLLLYWNKDKK